MQYQESRECLWLEFAYGLQSARTLIAKKLDEPLVGVACRERLILLVAIEIIELVINQGNRLTQHVDFPSEVIDEKLIEDLDLGGRQQSQMKNH